MTIEIDISIEAEQWAALPGLEDLIRRSVEAAAAEEGLAETEEIELSVLLCDDAAVRVLNRTWRAKDKPTNVLSFPAPASPAPGMPRLLGDIAVAFETTAREAKDEGKTIEDHLAHLIVHGVLHLFDYDHEKEDEAVLMEEMERRSLARLGIADPYAGSEPERVSAP